MTMIIECTSRDWDVENITNALVLPAQRQYVGHLTVDNEDAQTTFEGDVRLLALNGDTLVVAPWIEAVGEAEEDKQFDVPVADIRRVEFY